MRQDIAGMHRSILLTCPSGQLGGTEMRMLQEAELLSEFGYRLSAMTPHFAESRKLGHLFEARGVSYQTYLPPRLLTDWRRRHLNWVRAEILARPAFRRLRPDLVHVFFPWTNQGLDQLWLCGRNSIPAVVSAHNAFPPSTFSSWHRGHFRTVFRSVKGVYGVSQAALDGFLANFGDYLNPSVDQRVIYNSVDMQRFQQSDHLRARTRKALGIPPDAPVIGSVGRLDKQKQPLTLIETFQSIRAERPDARLVLIGQGDLRGATLEMLRSKGLEASTTLLPFQDDIEAYFPAFDVHLLMSRNEGFGIVTAEAMSCGVPVVGTRVPGTEEVIGNAEAGRLVPKDDTDAAARAVLDLLAIADRSPESLRVSPRDHVAARFSQEIWRENACAFYETVIDALSRRGGEWGRR